jgi:hypothetical protein
MCASYASHLLGDQTVGKFTAVRKFSMLLEVDTDRLARQTQVASS